MDAWGIRAGLSAARQKEVRVANGEPGTFSVAQVIGWSDPRTNERHEFQIGFRELLHAFGEFALLPACKCSDRFTTSSTSHPVELYDSACEEGGIQWSSDAKGKFLMSVHFTEDLVAGVNQNSMARWLLMVAWHHNKSAEGPPQARKIASRRCCLACVIISQKQRRRHPHASKAAIIF